MNKSFRELVEESLHEQQLDEGKLRDILVKTRSIGQLSGTGGKLNKFASADDMSKVVNHHLFGKSEHDEHNANLILNHPKSTHATRAALINKLGANHPIVVKSLQSSPHSLDIAQHITENTNNGRHHDLTPETLHEITKHHDNASVLHSVATNKNTNNSTLKKIAISIRGNSITGGAGSHHTAMIVNKIKKSLIDKGAM
jgi:hypothetical protein